MCLWIRGENIELDDEDLVARISVGDGTVRWVEKQTPTRPGVTTVLSHCARITAGA